MDDFLRFFDKKKDVVPMHLNIYYSKIMDYCINIYRAGCAPDGGDEIIVEIQECDVELTFAKAQVALKEWLSENMGGY
ncbi:MAG: hypothetical protein NC131_13520 [Roseburia sp.]|nr:hypothetical protein [Roseburia sp.]